MCSVSVALVLGEEVEVIGQRAFRGKYIRDFLTVYVFASVNKTDFPHFSRTALLA